MPATSGLARSSLARLASLNQTSSFMSWLPIEAICSPSRRASLSTPGAAWMSASTETLPALYPGSPSLGWAPAMVPPVARMTTRGSSGVAARVAAVRTMARGCSMAHLLFHENDDDGTPRREQDVPDGVGNGVAEDGELAPGLVLDRAKSRGDGPGARAGAEQDDRVHLEHVAAEQERRDMR